MSDIPRGSAALTAVEALGECGLALHVAEAVVHDLDLIGWEVRRQPRLGALANAHVVFWQCPVEAHHHSYPEPIRETVRWIDGVAHCMEPGCGRTSANEKEASDAV